MAGYLKYGSAVFFYNFFLNVCYKNQRLIRLDHLK